MAEIDLQASVTDIKVDRGEAVMLTITVTDASTGNPKDITNDTVQLVVDYPMGTQLFKLENGPTEHSDPSNGVTQFQITHAHTMLAPADPDNGEAICHWAAHWKDDSTPANEDIAACGRLRVRAVAVDAIT